MNDISREVAERLYSVLDDNCKALADNALDLNLLGEFSVQQGLDLVAMCHSLGGDLVTRAAFEASIKSKGGAEAVVAALEAVGVPEATLLEEYEIWTAQGREAFFASRKKVQRIQPVTVSGQKFKAGYLVAGVAALALLGGGAWIFSTVETKQVSQPVQYPQPMAKPNNRGGSQIVDSIDTSNMKRVTKEELLEQIKRENEAAYAAARRDSGEVVEKSVMAEPPKPILEPLRVVHQDFESWQGVTEPYLIDLKQNPEAADRAGEEAERASLTSKQAGEVVFAGVPVIVRDRPYMVAERVGQAPTGFKMQLVEILEDSAGAQKWCRVEYDSPSKGLRNDFVWCQSLASAEVWAGPNGGYLKMWGRKSAQLAEAPKVEGKEDGLQSQVSKIDAEPSAGNVAGTAPNEPTGQPLAGQEPGGSQDAGRNVVERTEVPKRSVEEPSEGKGSGGTSIQPDSRVSSAEPASSEPVKKVEPAPRVKAAKIEQKPAAPEKVKPVAKAEPAPKKDMSVKDAADQFAKDAEKVGNLFKGLFN